MTRPPLTPHDFNSCQSPLDTEGASNCAENCGHISKFYLNLICVHVFLVLYLWYLSICVCICICAYVCICNYDGIGQRVRTLLLSDPVKSRRSFETALARSLASNFFSCPIKERRLIVVSYFCGTTIINSPINNFCEWLFNTHTHEYSRTLQLQWQMWHVNWQLHLQLKSVVFEYPYWV